MRGKTFETIRVHRRWTHIHTVFCAVVLTIIQFIPCQTWAQRRDPTVQPRRPPRRNLGTLRANFATDPLTVSILLIGAERVVEVALANLIDAVSTHACPRMLVSARPDITFTVHPSLSRRLLRIWVSPNDALDPGLLMLLPDGRFRCNDDHGRSDWQHPQWPVIELLGPQPGRYYLWLGSTDNLREIRHTLTITTQPNLHP